MEGFIPPLLTEVKPDVINRHSPRFLPFLDLSCSVCSAGPFLAVFCSSRTVDASSSQFSVVVDLCVTSATWFWTSAPSFCPTVLPFLSALFVWLLRRFFLVVSLTPASASSSLSVEPPPSLMWFIILLTDFFLGLAGTNRGDDGHDSAVPETQWQKYHFHVQFWKRNKLDENLRP